MITCKYVKYGDFHRIVEEYTSHYIIRNRDNENVYSIKLPDDIVETRTYLPKGAMVRYHNQIGVICDVDINNFKAPYLINLGNTQQWCEFDYTSNDYLSAINY